ncbi:MAG: sugar ABC transporter ATP-binding protein [Planctomycetota bacterium]|nr:MAG: sugar ABC transporter ATP-binding protein [Planctomycetota bacterium]
MATSILECRKITKRFGGITALDEVDFDLRPGEVHGLVGSNGAGKSTLMKVLAGVHVPDDGEIRVRGKRVRFASPRDASSHGVAMVYQELSGVGCLTVGENLFLGRQPLTGLGTVDWRSMCRLAERYLAELNIHIDVEQRLDRYPLVIRQMVEIARGVHSGAEVLILDEPTSALSPPETERLFALMRQLRDRGVAMVFISHFIEDVLGICDRVTILRDGKKVASSANMSKADVIACMLGEGVASSTIPEIDQAFLTPRERGEPVFSVRGLSCRGALFDIDFDVRPGEILGVYGFVGSGNQTLVHVVGGDIRPDRGRVIVDGCRLPPGNCRAAVERGVVLVPADRAAGLFPQAEVYKNVTIGHLKRVVGDWITEGKEVQVAGPLLRRVGCRPADPFLPVRNLSGGNQQKVVFARWLAGPMRVLLLDEPTRGMDVGAKEDVLGLVREQARAGVAVVLASTEPELILRHADRILVMKRGRIVQEFREGKVTKKMLMETA